MELDKTTIESIINGICEVLYKENKQVIDRHLHERGIVSDYIAPSLRSSFPKFDVNVEYNREGVDIDPKKDLAGKDIIPDILVHKQMTDDFNLVALEVKGYWNKEDRSIDEDKLRRLDDMHPYKFLYRLELNKEKHELIAVSKRG